MRTRLLLFLSLTALALGLCAWPGQAQGPKRRAKEEAAIEKNANAYVEAFHQGDAKAVAAFWTPDGDYTDQTGRHLKGRSAIEKAFTGLFAEHKGLKIAINSDSLRFLTPDVAIEDGTSEVFSPDGSPPSRAHYTIVHVHHDGQWLLSSVREAAFSPPSNYEHLQGLEWAIGEWAGETATGEAERLSLDWTDNKNFIVASFATSVKDVPVAGATQWIGWDPLAKRVRSWIFDAGGGFGEASWTQDGKKWVIKSSSVLQDGKKATATFIVAHVDAKSITLQSTDRSVDGKSLPDTKQVTLKRVQ